jgi:hypothetical protein
MKWTYHFPVLSLCTIIVLSLLPVENINILSDANAGSFKHKKKLSKTFNKNSGALKKNSGVSSLSKKKSTKKTTSKTKPKESKKKTEGVSSLGKNTPKRPTPTTEKRTGTSANKMGDSNLRKGFKQNAEGHTPTQQEIKSAKKLNERELKRLNKTNANTLNHNMPGPKSTRREATIKAQNQTYQQHRKATDTKHEFTKNDHKSKQEAKGVAGSNGGSTSKNSNNTPTKITVHKDDTRKGTKGILMEKFNSKTNDGN